jgi:hypothetical protein
VNPTIAAAFISGGVGVVGVVGTAVTAWIGSRNTRRATEQAIGAGAASTRATLTAAREGRQWDLAAAVYEETLAEVLHRQSKLHYEVRSARFGEESEQKIKDFFSTYEPLGWIRIQARLTAYASDRVLDAFEATRTANLTVQGLYRRRVSADDEKLAAEQGRPQAAHESQEAIDANALHIKLMVALEDAWNKDSTLIEVIRDELRSKPEAAMLPILPAALPAVRRRLWHRRKAVEE